MGISGNILDIANNFVACDGGVGPLTPMRHLSLPPAPGSVHPRSPKYVSNLKDLAQYFSKSHGSQY